MHIRCAQLIKFSGMLLLYFLATMPALISLLRINTFGGFDIAWFGQALYNVATTGQPMVTMEGDYNHTAQHFEPILYPMGWLFFLLQKHVSPFVMLMVTQSLLQFLCCFSVMRLALASRPPQLMGNSAAWVLAFSFFSFWGVISAQTFEFHPVTMGLSFSFLALVSNLRQSTSAIYFWSLSLLCGEMFLVVSFVGIGLTVALKSKSVSSIWALPIAFLCGCLALGCYLVFLAPFLRTDGQQSSLLGRYAELGSTPEEIINNLLTNPLIIVPVVFTREKLLFLTKISLFFVPTAVWVLAKPRVRMNEWNRSSLQPVRVEALFLLAGVLTAAAPLGKILLSNAETYLITRHHYLADVTPSLCLILTSILIYFFRSNDFFWPRKTISKVGLTICSVVAIFLFVGINFQKSEFYPVDWIKNIKTQASEHLPADSRKVLGSLDPTQSVYSDTFGFSHIISSRRFYYTEFTNASVYAKNGYPEYLLLVFRPLKKATGGYALHRSLEEIDSGLLAIAGTKERYRLVQKIAGQTDYGINIFRKLSSDQQRDFFRQQN